MLWDGVEKRYTPKLSKERFICSALQRVSASTNRGKLQLLISRRLGSSSTVEGYLDRKGFIKFRRQTTNPAMAKIQAFRHAWVDELIREFS